MTASAMLRGLIYSGKDFNHMAPAARSPEYERLLRLAVQQREEEERRMKAMTPRERDRYIDEWAARMAPVLMEDGCAIDRALRGNAAEPPSVLCTVCMDSGTEFTEEGPQPCTNRIHEEVKDG